MGTAVQEVVEQILISFYIESSPVSEHYGFGLVDGVSGSQINKKLSAQIKEIFAQGDLLLISVGDTHLLSNYQS